MNKYLVPIDYELARRTLSPAAVEEMQHFDVLFLDVASWLEDKRSPPCVSSLFSLESGGSFFFNDERYGERHVHNGTLVGTAENSERYYAAWLAQHGRSDAPDRKKQQDGGGIVISFRILPET
jgi:hypothetical protein